MIECDKCGANLTLDDEKCPYCNTINPDAIEHIRQLKLYQAKYATTNKKIKHKELGRNAKKLQVITVFFLLAVMLATMIFSATSTELRRDYDRAIRNSIKKEHYTNLIQQYINETRPLNFYSIHNFTAYDMDDDGRELKQLNHFTFYYVFLMNAIREDDRDKIVEYINEYIIVYRNTKSQKPENIKYVENLNSNLYNVFQYKYGFTKDEVKQLLSNRNSEDILKMMEEKLVEE